jgi:hypothetical protein
MEVLISLLPYIVMLIVAIPGFVALKNQQKLGDASVAEKYQEIAEKAAVTVKRLQAQVETLEKSVDVLQIKYSNLKVEADNLETWALKLCGQVTMLGAVPIKRPEYKVVIEPAEEKK